MEWSVLLLGGASGIGKTYIVNELAKIYNVKIIEVDDIYQTVKAVTTSTKYPAIHYWSSGINWKDVGVNGNVKWLSEVSVELIDALRVVVNNHLEDDAAVIIEGDFISPEFAASFNDSRVRSLFVYESDQDQIVQNYMNREGGSPQTYRASISVEYGTKLKNECSKYNINVVEARPWDTLLDRSTKLIV